MADISRSKEFYDFVDSKFSFSQLQQTMALLSRHGNFLTQIFLTQIFNTVFGFDFFQLSNAGLKKK